MTPTPVTGRRRWASPIALPDQGPTWVFSDVHGVRSGLLAALIVAGLCDRAENWKAPPGTLLIGLGDYIDRGADSLGVLELLWRLEEQAPQSSGRVVLLRGNHEQLLLSAAAGRSEAWHVWLSDYAGGESFIRSIGADPDQVRSGRARDLRLALDNVAPELCRRVDAMPEWAMWGRHTFLAHAGLPPHADPDLLEAGAKHLWQVPHYERVDDPTWSLDGPGFQKARRVGVERIVYGHVTQPGRVKVDQGGRTLGLDTNAAAISLLADGVDSGAAVTLARLPPHGSLAASEFVCIDTRNALDRAGMRPIRPCGDTGSGLCG